ncbi:STAS domain-containing protein [Desulfoluna sp.]|uniref:STAS domain-containing protein n=1 Tax=Desulfoluna sp. TaxID=2045199 RepID=UPI0026287ABA|nr:STAS domain-containing protein [Desulfoluna sp.]
MKLISRNEKGALIVSVEGRVDTSTAPELETYLKKTVDPAPKSLIVNLQGVKYISSAGLRVVLLIAKKLKASGGELVLAGLDGAVKEVFEISGFYSIFKIFDTEEAALAEG